MGRHAKISPGDVERAVECLRQEGAPVTLTKVRRITGGSVELVKRYLHQVDGPPPLLERIARLEEELTAASARIKELEAAVQELRAGKAGSLGNGFPKNQNSRKTKRATEQDIADALAMRKQGASLAVIARKFNRSRAWIRYHVEAGS